MSKPHRTIPTYPIYVTAFEGGVLLSLLWKHRKKVPNVVKQLLLLDKRLKEEAGVKVKKLPGNKIMLKDKDGNVIIRERYPWDDYTLQE